MARSGPEFGWFERGDGEPVVLLHGLLGNADDWEEVLDRLAPVCRAIVPVLPIFDPAFSDPSLGALVRHVVALLDGLGLARVTIGGHSLGGHVALEMALAFPHRVSGLVLTGSSGLLERGFTRGVPHRPTPAYVRDRLEGIFYDRRRVTPGWAASVHRTLTTPSSARRFIRFARATRRESVAERVSAITVPTLIVWGEDDPVTPLALARRFHALVAPSTLVVLPMCGHVPMLERPEPFAAIVRAWLEETRHRRVTLPPPTEAAR